nr:zinc finger BED domain-containing protein RICESLEEPER 2-like [Ipomoea batatas]
MSEGIRWRKNTIRFKAGCVRTWFFLRKESRYLKDTEVEVVVIRRRPWHVVRRLDVEGINGRIPFFKAGCVRHVFLRKNRGFVELQKVCAVCSLREASCALRLQHSGESVPHKPVVGQVVQHPLHLGEGNKETTTAPPRLRLTNVLHGRFEAPPTDDFNDDNDECENVDNLDVNCDGVGNENLDVGDEKGGNEKDCENNNDKDQFQRKKRKKVSKAHTEFNEVIAKDGSIKLQCVDIIDGVMKSTKDWGIEHKVFTISVVNTSNNDVAVRIAIETFSRSHKLTLSGWSFFN